MDLASKAVSASVAFPLHLLSSSIASSLANPSDTISWIDDSGNICCCCCWEWGWGWIGCGRGWEVELSVPGEVKGRAVDGERVVV